MNNLRTAAKQALRALRGYRREMQDHQPCDAERALEAALLQPEQEPVAYIHRQGNHWEVSERFLSDDEKARGWTEEPLYTHPPRREWQSLTADAVFANNEIMAVNASLGLKMDQLMDLVCAIDAPLKEKNHG